MGGGSCREFDPIEDTESVKGATSALTAAMVAESSIRLRILKAEQGDMSILPQKSCREFDPIEDTESLVFPA